MTMIRLNEHFRVKQSLANSDRYLSYSRNKRSKTRLNKLTRRSAILFSRSDSYIPSKHQRINRQLQWLRNL